MSPEETSYQNTKYEHANDSAHESYVANKLLGSRVLVQIAILDQKNRRDGSDNLCVAQVGAC
jgi:hypothetical protein